MNLPALALSLPLVFMLHDFEELIGAEPWLRANRAALLQRFPRLTPRLVAQLERMAGAPFTYSVFLLFALLTLLSFYTALCGDYRLWYGVLAVFTAHLLVHLLQWALWRRYIPCIITSLLALPYGFWALAQDFPLSAAEKWHWSGVAVLSVLALLALLHLFMPRLIYDKSRRNNPNMVR